MFLWMQLRVNGTHLKKIKINVLESTIGSSFKYSNKNNKSIS